jgi:ATP-binding cassette subfamily A (ABC1) protein 3
LQAQKAIDFSLISEFNPLVDAVSIELKRFSYQPYQEDPFIVLIIGFLPFIVLMSFIFTVIFTAKEIVQEKESGLKEAMKLMGMSSWVYWFSWYIKMQILLFPSLILMVISYKIKLPLRNLDSTAAIINKTDPVLFALFLFLYSSGFSTFTLVCSTLFKKSNNAAAGTGIIFFVSYMPNIIISLKYELISLTGKILLAFINNLAMSMGIQLIGIFEGQGYGINFSNITNGTSIQDSFSMAHVMVILFLNNFLHMFLIYYFDNLSI